MSITVPIGKVEKMLDVKYRVYEQVDPGESIVRTISYSLPSVLHEHVSVIAPTTYLGTMRAMKSHVLIKGPADDHVPALLSGSTQAGIPDICASEIELRRLKQVGV